MGAGSAAADPPSPNDPVLVGPAPRAWFDLGEGLQFGLTGRLRGDAVFDDTRPDDPRAPLFIPSESRAAGGQRGRGSLLLHARLTSLALHLQRAGLAGLDTVRVDGRLEADFFARPSSESDAVPRLRHAFVRVERRWPASRQVLALLAGQTDDAFSPLRPAVDGDLALWGTGNVGDRRPQLRAFYEWAQGTFANTTFLMAGLTGAVDARDADGNLIVDGERSERPTLQGGTGLHFGLPFAAAPLRVYLSWHRAFAHTDTRLGAANRSHHQAWAVGWSLELPWWSTGEGAERRDVAWFRAEVWRGKNLSDVQGGIGQGLNATTGTGIASAGGWAELALAPWAWLTLRAGVGVDDPDNGDGPAVASNHAAYASIEWRLDEVRLGVEYVYRRSGYRGTGPGTDHRVRLWLELAW